MTTPFLYIPTFAPIVNGASVPNGLLYTYAAGTTNPKPTFQDAAGIQPNTNPVQLDITGAATVRLEPGSYHFVLTDSTGTVVLWDQDFYNAPYLTASDLAALLNAPTAVENAASIIPTNLLYQPGNVLRYGADTTGIADSQAAFSQAVTVALQSAIDLVIPGGNYKLSAKLSWGFSGLKVRSNGKAILTFTNSGRCIEIDGGTGLGINNIRVEGLIKVVGNAATTDAWFIQGCHRSSIKGIAAECGAGFRINWCVCTVFELMCSINENGGSWAVQTPQAGLILDQKTGGGTVSGCTFINPIFEGITGGNGYGIDLVHTLQNNFQGGTSEGNKVGIFVETTSPSDNYGNTFVGMDFESNSLNDIVIQSGAGGSHTFIGINCNSACSNPNIDLAGGDNTSFVGGYIRQLNIQSGVSGTVVEGCQLSNSGSLGITGAGASGCRVIASTLVNGSRTVTSQVPDQMGSTSNAFVPTIIGATTAGTQTYSTQKCSYTQYGTAGNGFVDFAIALTLTANSGGSGNALVSLPVAARNIAGQSQSVMIGDYTGVTLGAVGRSLALRLSPGSTNAQLVECDSGSVNNLLAITAIGTTANIIISGRYLI